MIKVTVDEAAAFDMLSILEIKSRKSDPSLKQYEKMLESIIDQLGFVKTTDILKSQEYRKLLKANTKVFDYVDILNQDICICGLEVHKANMLRYKLKNKLQDRFFSVNLSEEKI